MPTAAQHFDMAYPYFTDANDALFVPVEVRAWAMDLAAQFRPTCLVDELKNLAQAHYAAYLISARFVAGMAFGSVSFSDAWGEVLAQSLRTQGSVSAQQAMSEAMSRSVTGPTEERQEGQVRTRYSAGGNSVSESLSRAFGSAWGYGFGSSGSTGSSRSTGGSQSTRSSGALVGPAAPYAAWAALAAQCGPVPGIDPTDTEATRPRGGILVRSNPVIVH